VRLAITDSVNWPGEWSLIIGHWSTNGKR
jgi:hypothetical protein